jgi:hypothetical protein
MGSFGVDGRDERRDQFHLLGYLALFTVHALVKVIRERDETRRSPVVQ